MVSETLPDTVNIALLAELHPRTGRPDRLCAVLAWTDRGERYLCRLSRPITTSVDIDELVSPAAGVRQLQLDLGGRSDLPVCSSAGRTWRTWALPSVPTDLRGLTVDQVGPAVARQLSSGARR